MNNDRWCNTMFVQNAMDHGLQSEQLTFMDNNNLLNQIQRVLTCSGSSHTVSRDKGTSFLKCSPHTGFR